MYRRLIFLAFLLFSACTKDIKIDKVELMTISSDISNNIKTNIYFKNRESEGTAKIIANHYIKIQKELNPIFNLHERITFDTILIKEDLFHTKTGAPTWVNAFYHNNRIFLKTNDNNKISDITFYNTLKHEYSHILINRVSESLAPAWIDEGFAMLLESPILKRELNEYKEWLKTNKQIKLKALKKSFTTLKNKEYKIAYLQSKLMTNYLKNKFGEKAIIKYFGLLTHNRRLAFRNSFKMSLSDFENQFETWIKTKTN